MDILKALGLLGTGAVVLILTGDWTILTLMALICVALKYGKGKSNARNIKW